MAASTTTHISNAQDDAVEVATVSVDTLHQRLGWPRAFERPLTFGARSLPDWKMELDDAPILRYLFRHLRPRRHLEFGTWLGHGALCCLTESEATVWTINLPDGERHPDGGWAYPSSMLGNTTQNTADQPSDTIGTIGRLYRHAGLGHRVCQIYCDSRQWDTSAYPRGFFDSALIDGGHDEATVMSDTMRALPLVRPGGLLLWHDFCPANEVMQRCSSTRGVYAAIRALRGELLECCADLFWIEPSWLLLGVKR